MRCRWLIMSDVCVCGCGGLEAMKNTQWFILLFGKRFAIVCFLLFVYSFSCFNGTLSDRRFLRTWRENGSLNPYSNGTPSDSKAVVYISTEKCLNPYSNGILSDSKDR